MGRGAPRRGGGAGSRTPLPASRPSTFPAARSGAPTFISTFATWLRTVVPLQLPIKLHTPPSPVIQPPPPPPPPPPGQTVATLSKLTTGKARPSKLRKGKRTARLKLTKQGKKTLRGKSSITLKLVAQRTDGGPKLTKTLPFN